MMVTLCFWGKKTPTKGQKIQKKLVLNDFGQISIFFSTTIVVMITFMAFIINIGIFVKAKINLQNATDAAAYAGASVQARQLTNISYMNWEMRNVYKQWMFKYYVLGGLSLEAVSGPRPSSGSCPAPPASSVSFTMSCYQRAEALAVDKYNFPSVCIDFANTGDVGLCTRYLVPGLPRFEASNVLGMDETTNAFIDTIVSEKSNDCSERSRLNFLTANLWAYNVLNTDAPKDIALAAPQVSADSMGAFPQAFELAARIRNLEAEVNEPPMQGVCVNPSSGVNCSVGLNSLNTPAKERTLKAYQSAWRNIGANQDKLMKNTFTLTEIPPRLSSKPKSVNSLSSLLIPSNSSALDKYYLDLKLMTVNLATFYTAFTSTQGQQNVGGTAVSSEGQCNATKIGLPVPGYPLGFNKNPDFLTYYAVEGKSKFVGMFNPFANDIILKAYAAAKPFGGKIGPMLFNTKDIQLVKPRTEKKSSPYISGLNTAGFRGTFGTDLAGSLYAPGMPIPINSGSGAQQFWIASAANNVGGWISGPDIVFGVPNIMYDYPGNEPGINDDYHSSTQDIEIISYGGAGDAASSFPKAGLYNKSIFNKFKSKLKGLGGVVETPAITSALQMIKSPTLYEAHNYLIPTPEDLNKKIGTDSWGAIGSRKINTLEDNDGNQYDLYTMKLYAPLFSATSIYKSPSNLQTVLEEYITQQTGALEKYRYSMNIVATDIYMNNRSATSGQNTGEDAAKAISNLEGFEYEAINSSANNAQDLKPGCRSMAGKFLNFYTGNTTLISGDTTECNTSLVELMRSRWSKNENVSDIYEVDYTISKNLEAQLFTAYQPGPRQSANKGVHRNILSKQESNMIRNFYSTKFIPLKSLKNTGSAAYGTGNKMVIFSEGKAVHNNNNTLRDVFENPLNEQELNIDLSNISH